jgi:ribosomal subunit interface protein
VIKIQLRKTDVVMSDVLRMHVESRLGLALSRFADRIGTVIVRLSHAVGDRRGSHKRCQIEVGLRPHRLKVEDIDADSFAAVNHATDRVTRAVARALEREAAIGHGGQRAVTSPKITRHPP